MIKLFKKRGFIVWDTLVWWLIAIVILVLGFILIASISEKGQGIIEYFKTLWRFGS